MSAHGSDLPEAKGSKPDIGEILRPRPDEAQQRGAFVITKVFVLCQGAAVLGRRGAGAWAHRTRLIRSTPPAISGDP